MNSRRKHMLAAIVAAVIGLGLPATVFAAADAPQAPGPNPTSQTGTTGADPTTDTTPAATTPTPTPTPTPTTPATTTPTTTTPTTTTPTTTTTATVVTPTTTTAAPPSSTTPVTTTPTQTNTTPASPATPTSSIPESTPPPPTTTKTTQTQTTPPPPPPAPYTTAPPPEQSLASDGQDNRYLLDGTWLYRPDPSNVGVDASWFAPSESTSAWHPVSVPDSFNAGDLSSASFYGSVGWYRRDFTLPADGFPSYVPKAAQQWVIQFESVNYRATVWLNGHMLGRHQGANLPFEFTLRDLKPGVNTLVVRVSDELTAGDFPPRTPGGGWWNFGGILDAVYLRPSARADIDGLRIRTPMSCPTCMATVEEQATIRNLSGQPQTVTLTGRYGSRRLSFGTKTLAPGRTWKPTASVNLPHPRLWQPADPYLYDATLLLTDSRNRPLTAYTYQSGVRTIMVKGGLVYLNDEQVHLRGVNIHEQNVQSGSALTLAQQQQLIGWVQALGGDVIRAHYPLDPEMEQMADQDGILLWSEVPVYHPGRVKLASATWRARAVALVKENIAVNQDHPSIMVWSVGNELGSPPQPWQPAYVTAAAKAVHAADPTRPAAIAITDWPGLACQSEYHAIDVIGVNEYFGWFDSGGGTSDDRNQLAPFFNSVRACYPNKGIFISEFGFGGNRNGPTEVRGTYQYQENEVQFHLNVMASEPWLAGAMYFPMQDFAASPNFDGSDPLGVAPYVDKGMLDQYGNVKPAFAVMSQIYHATPAVQPFHIGRSLASKR